MALIRRYFPDLSKFIMTGERNYARLLKLVKQWQEGEKLVYRCGEDQHLVIEVLEEFTYTSGIKVTFELNHAHRWIPAHDLTVRLYHDARIAEVVSTKCYKRLEPVYKFPNNQGIYPDEKQQMNQLLADWLVNCLENGYICELD